MNYLKHNIWAVVTIGVVFSFIFPSAGVLLSPFIHLIFMVLTFFSTIDIKIPEVLRDIQRPKKTFIILAIIHLLSPLLVFCMKPFLDPSIYLGLIIATVVPSGISVIFLTKLFGGDTSRSLVITTLSSLISPIVVPALILLFAGQNVEVSPLAMGWTIFKLIVLPFLLAQYVAHTQWKKRLTKRSTDVLIISLLLIIIGIISPVRNYIFENLLLSLMMIVIISVLNLINFVAGFSLGSFMGSKISYGVSASFKNFALSTVLAMSLFGATVALPAIIYAIVNSFMLIPMQWFIHEKLEDSRA